MKRITFFLIGLLSFALMNGQGIIEKQQRLEDLEQAKTILNKQVDSLNFAIESIDKELDILYSGKAILFLK